jgi:hypothetical protein
MFAVSSLRDSTDPLPSLNSTFSAELSPDTLIFATLPALTSAATSLMGISSSFFDCEEKLTTKNTATSKIIK